jgi:hypothetical protein
MKITNICLIVLLTFSIFSVIPIVSVKAQLTENLRVHIDLVETFPNGNLTSSPLDGVQVKVTRVETGESKIAYTSDGGWARFWLNYTGQYNLTAIYKDYKHITKKFYIDDINRVTYIYDNMYKLAVFFAGDQLTVFHTIKVELPSVVVFKIPRYTNFTSHIDAYGGLRFEQTKLEDRYVFKPFDITGPRYTEKGEIFYPNYTVSLSFKTLEMGNIALMIGSNATYSLVADPLYTVPANVWVKITFVVFTFTRPEVQQLNKIENMLETILSILLQIRDMINKTVIPKLQKIHDGLTFLSNVTVSSINEKTSLIYDKIREIDTNVKMVRDTLNMFTKEFKDTVKSIFVEETGDIKTTTWVFGGLALFVAVLIGAGYRKSKSSSKEEYRSVVVK